MSEDLGFVHRFVPGNGANADVTLLLLHGTGGDEDNLLPLGRSLLSGAAILSPRGQVNEAGALRFFRRLREGVFDQADLAKRTDDLAEFVRAGSSRYGFNLSGLTAAGFSNGANIAGSLLLKHPGLVRRAVLLAPMVPFEPEPLPRLEGTNVFIGAGRSDSMVPPALTERLAELLRESGASVTIHWDAGGHAITPAEVSAAADWLTRTR
jgi:phospholipase/carboxylesterase